MKKKRLFVIVSIVIICLFAAMYTQRVKLKQFIFQQQKPDLPEAVGFEELPPVDSNTILGEPGEVILEPGDTLPEDIEVQDLPETNDVIEEEDVEIREITEQVVPDNTSSNIPAEYNLAVPFTSQAPHANWSLPYQEACEEASVYMVHSFYEGMKGQISANATDAEIKKMVEFENTIFGDYQDTSAAQTALFIEQFYGYSRVDIIENPTADLIKRNVAAGRPVIIPAAGQQLGNPYFTAPGPLYHMLVVKGYTETGFITNDPGTRNGEEFFYKTNTLMNAIHDWNDGDVVNGKKVVIVIYPEI